MINHVLQGGCRLIRVRQLWNSVFVKFSAAFLLVGLVPLIALSIFSLQTFTGHVERHTISNLTQMTFYISNNLNNAYAQYNQISKFMYTNQHEALNISKQTYNVNELEQINQMHIDAFLTMIVNSDPYIRNAHFVRKMDGKLYFQASDTTNLLTDFLPIMQWMIPLEERPQHLAIYPTHPESYYFDSEKRVVTFGRNLIDISGTLTREPIVVGTLFFDVDASVFDNLFKELNLGKNDELYVLDKDGVIHFSNQAAIGNNPEISDRPSDDFYVLQESIPFLDGRLIIRVSKSDLFEQLTSTRSTVFTAISICALALIIMGIWFSRRLANPIRGIIKQMVKVESGNLDVGVIQHGKDEIGRLAYGFNRMVERLKLFINEAYVAEIKQKQAELNALKSQIRPHYLYNTLEVIRMNAVHNDDDEVADMILSLSNQLKYVIDYGEEWVSIRRELEHLKDYFYIIRVRFENRFELRLEISDEIDRDDLVLKLSLQPIVENAIQHGIRPKGGKGSVLVTMDIVDDNLSIIIYDDGVGIDEERLAELERQLNETKAPTTNVGIKNVHERIRRLCGEPYGLEISSRKHIGTSVRLLFPIKKREENNYDDTSRTG